MAKALWKRGENPLAKALIARRMYLKLARKYRSFHNFDENVYDRFITNAK